MRTWLIALALASASGAAAATLTPNGEDQGRRSAARTADQCFSARTVNDFRPYGRDQVDVRVSSRRWYRLDLGAGCLNVDWAQRIALRTRTGSSFICSPLDAEIIAPSGFGAGSVDRCLVTGIRRLSDAEVLQSRMRRTR